MCFLFDKFLRKFSYLKVILLSSLQLSFIDNGLLKICAG